MDVGLDLALAVAVLASLDVIIVAVLALVGFQIAQDHKRSDADQLTVQTRLPTRIIDAE